ncbi:MAG: hypothetical protein ACXAC5_00260 [Promethearchaeota archaeon]|jgi:hypothetical protein
MAVFAPHLTSPKGGEIFNLGIVTITWDNNDPPTDDPYEATTVISYEIEYTDNYQLEDTVWHTLKRRIPWTETSFDWVVGKMIKSSSVRVRTRAKNSLDGLLSDWSMSGGDFSVNVFKLIPPAIVSPLPTHVYTDFILIILDETLTKNTFNQKVRYTLEYSSEKRGVDWTVIAQDIPVGQNVIRWDLDDLTPSDDYVLRLTAKNAATSCLQSSQPTPDQISRRFVYNLKIQQPGMFLIDTKPPQAVLDVEGSAGITSELIHTLNIFAEDATSEVEQIQLRECDATTTTPLGKVEDIESSDPTECSTISELISEPDADFGKLIGKPLGYSTKTQWTFEDTSGTRRLEALLIDSGGNTSIQDIGNTFIPIYRHDFEIQDLIVAVEQRDSTIITEDDAGNAVITTEEDVNFEVAYLATSDGGYWVLEPFPRRIVQSDRDIRVLFAYQGSIYLFTYTNNELLSDEGFVFRDDKSIITAMFSFPNSLSIPNAVAEFQNVMYMGLENGELWQFNGITVALTNTFPNPISTLSGDNEYLYIGLSNSSLVTLYNGTDFFTSDVET